MRRRRDEGAVSGQRRLHIVTRIPVYLGEFCLVDRHRIVVRTAMTPDHQLARKRPRLAGDISYVAHRNAAFLQHFAGNGFLYAFARFHEPRQRGETPFGPALAPPQHQSPVMLDQHDRDRVGAREMAGPALCAIALPAAFGQLGAAAALRAEAMARVPVDNAARAAIQRQIVRPHRRHERPELRVGHARRGIPFRWDGNEARLAIIEAQKDQFGVLGRIGERAPGKASGIVHAGHEVIQRKQPGLPVHHPGKLVGIGTNVIRPVEAGAGERNHRSAHASSISARSFLTISGKDVCNE